MASWRLNTGIMKKRIVIIGSGPGGLTSGMLLAHRGYEVTILEKAPVVGGRNASIKAGGYTFDTGPTFLHQKFTLDEIFAEVGRKPEDHLNFTLLDPMTRLTWGGVSMETSSNEDTMVRNIEAAFPGHSGSYRRFMSDHAEKLRAHAYKSPITSFATTLVVKCSRRSPTSPPESRSWTSLGITSRMNASS